MTIDWSRVKETLAEALEVTAEHRSDLVRARCEGDPSLQRTVERLLAGLDSSTGFLDDDSCPPSATTYGAEAGATAPPQRIGPYTVHEAIGEGGFGVVHRATQSVPFARELAIKLLKPRHGPQIGADAIGRLFRGERDALARLDHPDICRVLDAGITEDGSPFVAMELVRGESILDFCRRRTVDVRTRAALVARCARALHHAHQRALLHCDVKPSNILVNDVEGLSLRVIDFGIARAIDASSAGHAAGTPRYMSPERRADPRAADVRSDVYSLGAVLVDLLDDADRHRITAPAVTLRELRAIAARATADDPDDRYDSAAALADDLERSQRLEPVRAMGDGLAYRAGRFAARHRSATVLGLLAALSIAGGVALTLKERGDALEARDDALREKRRSEFVTRFLLDDMLGSLDPDIAKGTDITVVDLLEEVRGRMRERLTDDPRLLSDVAAAVGIASSRIGSMPEAVEALELAVATRGTIEPVDWASLLQWRLELAHALLHLPERHQDAMSLRARTLVDARAALGDDHPITMRARLVSFDPPADWNDRVAELRSMVAVATPLGREGEPVVEGALTQIATILAALGRRNEEIATLSELLTISEARVGALHSATIAARRRLGLALVRSGDADAGIAALERSLADARTLHEPGSPSLAGIMVQVASALADAGRVDQSLVLARECERTVCERQGPDSAACASAQRLLGQALVAAGSFAEALPILDAAVPALRRHWGPHHAQVAPALVALAQARLALGQHAEALAAAEEATLCSRAESGVQRRAALVRLDALARLGRPDEAAAAYRECRADIDASGDSSLQESLEDIARRHGLDGGRSDE